MPSVHLTSMMNTKIWNLNFLALNCLPIMYVQFLDLLQFCYILKDKPPTWRPHQFCRDRMFGSVGHLEYYVYDFSIGKLVCHFFSPKKYFGFYFDCIEEQSKATLNPSDTLGKASFFTHTGDSHDGCGWAEEPWWTVQPLVEARLLFHNRPNIGRSLLGFGSSDQTGPASERDATAGQKVQLHRETWAPGPDTPCNFLSSSDKMLFLHFCFC